MADTSKPMEPAPPTATVGGTPAGATQQPVVTGGAPGADVVQPADVPASDPGAKYVFVPRDQAVYQGKPYPERPQDVPPVILGGPSPYGTDQNNQPMAKEDYDRIKEKREALNKGEAVKVEDVTVPPKSAPPNPSPPTGPATSPTAAAPPGGK